MKSKPSDSKVKLSILCIAYNHGKFIRQALDGFVMQKTNFAFDVLINDDASTDDTAKIIHEYEKKYPDIVKPIYQKQNQFSRGVMGIDKKFNWPRISGEYVAICEGDDYWTDENKLQVQVDFLDKNPDYSICFHPVKIIWDDNSNPDSIFPTPDYYFNKTTLELYDLLKHNFIQTNSVVYRWALAGRENLLPDDILPIDYFIHLLHAQVGKISFLPDVMAVYRRHTGGIWYGCGETDQWFLKNVNPHIAFYAAIQKQFNYDKSSEIKYLIQRAIMVFLKYGEFEKIREIKIKYPDIYNEIIGKFCGSKIENINPYFKKYKKYKRITNILIPSIIALTIGLVASILI